VPAETKPGAALRVLPAVALSGSALRQDRTGRMSWGARACVAKPAQLGRHRALVRAVRELRRGAAHRLPRS
jgi:CheY-like chemotaxis protein